MLAEYNNGNYIKTHCRGLHSLLISYTSYEDPAQCIAHPKLNEALVLSSQP